MVSGGGAKPWRQKGTGRARAGSNRSPIWTGGGTVFGPQPRSYTFKVNRKEHRAALRSALSLHAERGSLAVLDAAAFDEPKTKPGAELLADWGQARPTLVVLARRGVRGGAVVPQPRPRRGAHARERRRRPTSRRGLAARLRAGARRADARAPARRRVRRGGGGLMEPTQVIIRPVVSEKSYVLSAADRYTFRVHPDAHKTQIRQAVEALFDVHVVEVRTLSVKSKPKRRGVTRGRTRAWKKAIVQVRAGESIPIFQGLQALEGGRVAMPIRKPKPTSPGRRFVSYPDFAEITTLEAREDARRRPQEERRAQRRTGARPRATAAAAPSAPTGASTSSGARTACPRSVAAIEYDPNRSAYIALLHYADGEKRYILAPQRLDRRDDRRIGRGRRHRRRQLPRRSRACRSARSFTTSSCSPAAAVRWRARRAPRCS